MLYEVITGHGQLELVQRDLLQAFAGVHLDKEQQLADGEQADDGDDEIDAFVLV